MRKTLTQKSDPLIQIRVTDSDFKKLLKLADKETRTLPNLIKSIVLAYIK